VSTQKVLAMMKKIGLKNKIELSGKRMKKLPTKSQQNSVNSEETFMHHHLKLVKNYILLLKF